MKADEILQYAREAQRQERFKDAAVLLQKDPRIHIVWLSGDAVETARRVLRKGGKPIAILGVVDRYHTIEIRIARFPGARVSPDYLEQLVENFAVEYEARAGCATMWEN